MALASKKQLPHKKPSSSTGKDELVPIRFTIDETLYAFLEQLSERSGKSVSEIATMYLVAEVDPAAKIDPRVDRAMQQIEAEDIARRFGPLLRLLSPRKIKKNVTN